MLIQSCPKYINAYMPAETVTLQIPEIIYTRLINTAKATHRPLEEVILRALAKQPKIWNNTTYCLKVTQTVL